MSNVIGFHTGAMAKIRQAISELYADGSLPDDVEVVPREGDALFPGLTLDVHVWNDDGSGCGARCPLDHEVISRLNGRDLNEVLLAAIADGVERARDRRTPSAPS